MRGKVCGGPQGWRQQRALPWGRVVGPSGMRGRQGWGPVRQRLGQAASARQGKPAAQGLEGVGGRQREAEGCPVSDTCRRAAGKRAAQGTPAPTWPDAAAWAPAPAVACCSLRLRGAAGGGGMAGRCRERGRGRAAVTAGARRRVRPTARAWRSPSRAWHAAAPHSSTARSSKERRGAISGPRMPAVAGDGSLRERVSRARTPSSPSAAQPQPAAALGWRSQAAAQESSCRHEGQLGAAGCRGGPTLALEAPSGARRSLRRHAALQKCGAGSV